MNELPGNDGGLDLESALTQCAWRSSEYAQQLREDPNDALRRLGVSMPPGVWLDARVQRRDTLYFVVPPMTCDAREPEGQSSSPPNQMDLWRSADQFCWILPERLKIELLNLRQSHRRAVSKGAGLLKSSKSTIPSPPDRENRYAEDSAQVPAALSVHERDGTGRSRTVDPADHYRLITSDSAARKRLLTDPKTELHRYFGYLPTGDYRIEAIDQRHDTITALLPSPPHRTEMIDEALIDARGRIYDILFTTGVGGYLIPDDSLKWILRDMRSAWIEGRRPQGKGGQ